MEIPQIKTHLSLQRVLEHYHLVPNKSNHICCPFHDDKTPSLKIYPHSNTYHCFGCGENGDVIQFIQDKEKCSKHEALKKATALAGIVVAPNVPSSKVSPQVGELPFGTDLEGTFLKLQQNLNRSKKAIAYLENRGIYNAKISQGYNENHYPKLRACIVYPLKNALGNIVSFYGRSVRVASDNKGSAHYYLANRKGLYPGYPKLNTQTLLLTESIIDAASLQIHTDYEVLAMYGVNGFTAEHKEAINQLEQLSEIILFFDGDAAGNETSIKLSKELAALYPKISISKVETPDDEDINTLIQNNHPEILKYLIENRDILVESTIKKALVTGNLNTTNPDYLSFKSGVLLISILGGIPMTNLDKLKVTLRIERTDKQNPLYTLRQSNIDLYNDDMLTKLVRKLAERLELGNKEVQSVLFSMLGELEAYRLETIAAKTPEKESKRILNASQKQVALDFLKATNLLKRTNELIGKTGLVGEENNRLLMFLIFTSRLREQPLHVISLGASGTGKTYLQEKIAALIPREHKLEITTLSENALYYFDRKELKNKLVLIEDLDGAQDDKILYAIRELMSKKKISKTIPIKDAKGNMKTITLQVEGPITLAGTTTKEKIYEDNANRSILIYLDNSSKQKQNIIKYQQELSAGVIDKVAEGKATYLLQDMQCMLAPVKVRNPFATQLHIPETVFKPLRTNAHYLAFIETVTFYHQFQRKRKTTATNEEYIETTLEDIEIANSLLKEVLLTKSDELTKGCRDFFERVKVHLGKESKHTFYSNEIRTAFRMNPSNVKYYLAILSKYQLIKVIGGHPRKQGYEYEIISTTEYERLQESMNALDVVLSKIKKACLEQARKGG